jgi:hypothetical protein
MSEMVDRFSEKHFGLTVGLFAALAHALWALFVASGMAGGWASFKQAVHFVYMPISVGTFDMATAVMGILTAFAAGYIGGAVFAWIWNAVADATELSSRARRRR